jgi:HD superfamily phosphohydrolase YqeK
VTDADVLNAIRYHTSAREGMSALEKLIFLADMVEPSRCYEGVEALRELFFEERKGADGLDKCLKKALAETVLHLQKKGGEIYPLTLSASRYYNDKD